MVAIVVKVEKSQENEVTILEGLIIEELYPPIRIGNGIEVPVTYRPENDDWMQLVYDGLRKNLPYLRQCLLSIAVIDQILAQIALMIFMVLSWVFMLNVDIERVLHNWNNVYAYQDIILKDQILVMTTCWSFGVVCFTYTVISHKYYTRAITKRCISFLTAQCVMEWITIFAKVFLLYFVKATFQVNSFVFTATLLPIGYQLASQFYLTSYLYELRLAFQTLRSHTPKDAVDDHAVDHVVTIV